jgi:hypothetical protein
VYNLIITIISWQLGSPWQRDVNLDDEYEMKLLYLEWKEIMQVFKKKDGPSLENDS